MESTKLKSMGHNKTIQTPNAKTQTAVVTGTDASGSTTTEVIEITGQLQEPTANEEAGALPVADEKKILPSVNQ